MPAASGVLTQIEALPIKRISQHLPPVARAPTSGVASKEVEGVVSRRAPGFRASPWLHILLFEARLVRFREWIEGFISLTFLVLGLVLTGVQVYKGHWVGLSGGFWGFVALAGLLNTLRSGVGGWFRALLEAPALRSSESVDAQVLSRNAQPIDRNAMTLACYHGAVVRYPEVDRHLCTHGDFRLVDDTQRRSEILDHLRKNRARTGRLLRTFHSESRTARRMFHDDWKVCLANELDPRKPDAYVFRGSFFLSALTHDLTHLDIIPSVTSETMQNESTAVENLRSHLLDEGGRIRSIDVTRTLPNHIGVNTLAITSDGWLQLWVQSISARYSGLLLGPTGSGSLDWKDRRGTSSLREMLIRGMQREYLEESTRVRMKLDPEQIAMTEVIGYFRNIGRGGLPGFVGITMLRARADQLKPNNSETYRKSEWQHEWPAKDPERLICSLRELLEKPERLSVPLHACTAAVLDTSEKHPRLLETLYKLQESFPGPQFVLLQPAGADL
jgi:hypothetical protein